MKKNNANQQRDYSWALTPILIVVFITMIIGIVSYTKSIIAINKQNILNEYNNNLLYFDVIGTGHYVEKHDPFRFTVIAPAGEVPMITNYMTAHGFSVADDYKVDVAPTMTVIYTGSDVDGFKAHAEEEGWTYYVEKLKMRPSIAEAMAYQDAMNMAREKCKMIAQSLNSTFAIENVEELGSTFNEATGLTTTQVKMTIGLSEANVVSATPANNELQLPATDAPADGENAGK